jgi:hypothetical protein
MREPFIQCEFDGVTRGGRDIVIHIAIGDPEGFAKKNKQSNPGFFVEIEPLVGRRGCVGTDSFMAMCFGIELVRKALKIFVANGGSVYFRRTRSLIDLDSHWFKALGGLLRPEFLNKDPIPSRRKTKNRPRTRRTGFGPARLPALR